MNKIHLTLISLAILSTVGCGGGKDGNDNQPTEATPKKSKYEYQTVDGDPMGVKLYTLKNGLRVYMSVYKDAPRIQTLIATRAGSKNDPADATGLAHYLEHMLFKGSSKIGALDWEKEKVMLQEISDLYEAHRNAKPEDRSAIYNKIDSVSQAAAKLVAANEYDKMISSLGAKGTNAFTSLDRTVYVNDIPSNEIDKWLTVESARFDELVLRLFHTELEAVYEEFNIGQSRDGRKLFKEWMGAMLPNHPYGTQTTIGTGEHLKTPSMEKIHEYFNKYYVPNNMAIILAGDFDPDEVVEKIEATFGSYEQKSLEKWTVTPQEEIKGPVVREVFGKEKAAVDMGWRLPGAGSDEALMAEMVSNILYNGQAGLIDINLLQQQRVGPGSSSFAWSANDFSFFGMYGHNRPGQSLEEVKDLFLGQLDSVRQGKFEDWMLDAIVNNLEYYDIKQSESNAGRAYKMLDAFIYDHQWNTYVDKYERMRKITKQQLMDFVAKYLREDNHVIVYKREGEDKNIYKVEKPTITPIEVNRDTASTFRNNFNDMVSPRQKPVFVDFKSKIQSKDLGKGVTLDYIKNEDNKTFGLYYVLDMGEYNDPELPIAVKYLPFLGTSKYSAAELKKEFFKLGVSFDVYSSTDVCYVTLTGLERSLDKGVELFEHILANVEPNEAIMKNMVADVKKNRQDAKKDKSQIFRIAMMNYGKHGDNSPLRNKLSSEQMDGLNPQQLVDKIKGLTGFEHTIFYYGSKSMDEVAGVLGKHHKVEGALKPIPTAAKFPELDMTEDKVVFVNFKDMPQAEIMMLSKGTQGYDPQEATMSRLYNDYFGAGLSSIVFQEIRESRALAYSSYVFNSAPRKQGESHYLRGFVGTQVDKMPTAIPALRGIIDTMPVAEDQIGNAIDALLKKVESERITKSSIYWTYRRNKKLGYDYDMRKDAYDKFSSYSAENTALIDEFKKFQEDKIKGRKYTFMVLGNKGDMDMDYLKSLGDVKEMSVDEIFGAGY